METRDFRSAFFGGRGFESMNDLRDKWSKMTPEEKVELMDKRMDAMNDRFGMGGREGFDVAAIDKMCEKWWNMTAEDKEKFIKERKEAMANFDRRGHFFGHRGFGFGFCEHMNENL